MSTKLAVSNFSVLKSAVWEQFAKMQQERQLYRTAVDKDEMWHRYLTSFPTGTNNIFRKRAEYDCTCCKQFIRAVGNVVGIINGEVVSIWDGLVTDEVYATVAHSMSQLVKSKPIENVFLHYEKVAGTDKNYDTNPDSAVITWHHFYSPISNAFVKNKIEIPAKLGEVRSHYDVALRGLKELTLDSIDTVLELIAQNSLYRGDEHQSVLTAFKKVKLVFNVLPVKKQSTFIWENIDNGALRIRNTVIGTLLVDLSNDVDLEDAVKSFEVKVAPTNYKRPSSLITKSMIENAKKTIEELGLSSALLRRYATLDDISINNVLFADRSLRKKLGGEDVFDELIQTIGPTIKRKLDTIEEMAIDKFINQVLPKATSIEVLFENKHRGNLVSLIAPVDKKAGKLFKWNNRFSWSYMGELTDSIKERVKKAGGNVTGDLCNRLAWYNYDDLDLHMVEPGKYEIYYATRGRISPNGGDLDVDMNAGSGHTREPVENIVYPTRTRMKYGTYALFVHQYRKRENQDIGFEVEIDWMGDVYNFSYNKPLRQDERVVVANFMYSQKEMTIASDLDNKLISKQVWNIGTNQFQKVQAIMLSPNHWDSKEIGNRHWFFLLDRCKNDGAARGFYNEFLTEDLTKHRKVFEIVGSKTKVEDSDNQLSGLGFSSTKNDALIVRVKGTFTRELKIVF